MSGEHWLSLPFDVSNSVEDAVKEMSRVAGGMKLLSAIGNSLNYGLSADSCLDCAKLGTVAAICAWYDDGARDAKKAIAVLRGTSCKEHSKIPK